MVTTRSEDDPAGPLLLAAIVAMPPGSVPAGQRHEDAELGLQHRHGGLLERPVRTAALG